MTFREVVIGAHSRVWQAAAADPRVARRFQLAIGHAQLRNFAFTPSDRVWVFAYSRVPGENSQMLGVLEAAGVAIPELLRFVACDLAAENFESSLSAGLAAEGFSTGGRTLFIWEGVISYLNPTEIDRALCWMASVSAPGSRVVFNYTINQLSGIDPESMRARATAAGFASIDDRSAGSLYREYLKAEPPSEVADFFRLAVAVR